CSHVLVPLLRFRLLARLLVAGGGAAVYKLEDEDAVHTLSICGSGASYHLFIYLGLWIPLCFIYAATPRISLYFLYLFLYVSISDSGVLSLCGVQA
ncbi:hypothetical protein FB45DRAFT_902595, partial [Roridomyces roridus]